jgi:hypothetical protein
MKNLLMVAAVLFVGCNNRKTTYVRCLDIELTDNTSGVSNAKTDETGTAIRFNDGSLVSLGPAFKCLVYKYNKKD